MDQVDFRSYKIGRERLSKLPSEILNNIISLLNGSSLKSLRRSCKPFDVLVIPRLFQRVVIWLHPESFSILEACSEKEHLIKHVQHLRFDLHLFPVDEDAKNNWQSRAVYGTNRYEFHSAVRAQAAFEYTIGAVTRLGTALQRLTNLKTIEISSKGGFPVGGAYIPQPLEKHTVPSRFIEFTFAQLHHLMIASSYVDGGLHIERLIIDESDFQDAWDPHCEELAGLEIDFPPFNDCQMFLGNIRHFTWSMYPRDEDMSRELTCAFLGSMESLKEFNLLEQHDSEQNQWPEAFLLSIFQDVTWPQLEKVRLPGFVGHVDDFMDFFWRHSSTLRKVHLRNMSATNTSLEEFLHRIRECLTLDEFLLDGIVSVEPPLGQSCQWFIGTDQRSNWDEEDERWRRDLCADVEAFMTRKTEEYPWPQFDSILELDGTDREDDEDHEDDEDAEDAEDDENDEDDEDNEEDENSDDAEDPEDPEQPEHPEGAPDDENDGDDEDNDENAEPSEDSEDFEESEASESNDERVTFGLNGHEKWRANIF